MWYTTDIEAVTLRSHDGLTRHVKGVVFVEQVMSRVLIPKYSLGEELVNSISHGLGAAFGVTALILMVNKAQTPLAMVCAIVFGLTMISLYTVSCVYHALPPTLPGKRVMRVIDHCNVYLLVFGTYVPAALLGVGGALGWVLFGVVAFFTVLGIVFSSIDVDKYSKVQVACHLVSGWSFLAGMPAILSTQAPACGILIVAGGVAYTVGSILYGIGKRRAYMHSVFHLFCLLGTALHFVAIFGYLL